VEIRLAVTSGPARLDVFPPVLFSLRLIPAGFQCRVRQEGALGVPDLADSSTAPSLLGTRGTTHGDRHDGRIDPRGWSIDEVNDAVVVWTRSEPLAWPEGRLAQVSGPLESGGDVAERPHVGRVDFARTGAAPAELTFARLTWPGYEALVDGSPVPIRPGPAGLVTVSIPEEVTSGTVTLTWSPPLWRPSILAALLGLLLGIGTHVWWLTAKEHRLS
jgi:hypothetical protein